MSVKSCDHHTLGHCHVCEEWHEMNFFDSDLLGRVCDECADYLKHASYILQAEGLTRPDDVLMWRNP